MLFITNRFPTQSIRTRANRPFAFDLKNNAASNSVFYCEEVGLGQYQEVGSKAFLRRLKESNARQVLIYLHGFSNLPEDVFVAVREFQALCDASAHGEVLVVPLIWPCDNDLGVVNPPHSSGHRTSVLSPSIAGTDLLQPHAVAW
ncbi:hypothetical protein [Halomonas saccharevitans]|uniref:Alpha/beta hydrolase family protein n=1 Tax=Halomonas saccharevitans TaxID=416872 RepID=A0A1I7CZH5_9GAMM|nr:hypothetical protein [Halomonas saccharevitans]SFU04831.1 hypothetical protein SAMN04487956_1794 [Halomonas saccharevitans]